MKYNSRAISKYLDNYAEPDIRALNLSVENSFDAVLTIPIYDEPIEELLNTIDQFKNDSVLLIFVFNAPDVTGLNKAIYVENKDAQKRTVDVLEELVILVSAESKQGYFHAQVSQSLTLLILDYCRDTRKLPAKQGVGLARKLGVDLALKAVNQQYLECGKEVAWLHSSDADVDFPERYFDLTDVDSNASAVIYPFKHVAESGFEKAMALYDYSLRYYVEQLKEAGSPYAFHTIGSLIAIKPIAYASVRGFPKRSAGEDFYLLNKLAKVGEVSSLNRPELLLAGRPSHRVPFGTGPALRKISEMEEQENAYTFYNPSCFRTLRTLLDIISNAGQSFSSAELLFQAIKDRMNEKESAAVIQSLLKLKIDKQFVHLSQKQDAASFVKAFHTWFDAFVTLRFIHELRDSIYPNVSLSELPKLAQL